MQKAAEEKKQRKMQKNLGEGIPRFNEVQCTVPLDSCRGAGASYTTAQKVEASKVKAKDSDNDIFAGAGAFDVNVPLLNRFFCHKAFVSACLRLLESFPGMVPKEIVRKARAEQAAKKEKGDVKQEEDAPPQKAKGSSYFDDAGDEKYRCLAEWFSFLLTALRESMLFIAMLYVLRGLRS